MRRLSYAAAVLGIAILAACGGGGGGSSTGSGGGLPPAPTPTPSGATGAQDFASNNAVAIPSAAPGATTVPVALSSDATGASADAALPAAANVPTDTTIAVTYTSLADASLPTLASAVRKSAAARAARDETTKAAWAYLKLQFSADLVLPQAPGFTFTVPGAVPATNVTYWLAFYDPLRAAAGWQKGFEGPAVVTPATVNGRSATRFVFASNGQPITFVANQTYWFAVIAVVTNAPSPTPVPTTVPTNAPPTGHPSPVLSTPRNVQFASTSDAPQVVTFVESGFTGNFELHGDCTGIVNTTGSSPTWTLTPVGQGRCVIVALGDRGSTAVVHIGVVTPFETPRPSPTGSPSHSPEPTNPPTTSPSHSPEPTNPPTTSPSHSPEPTHPPTTAPTTSPTTSPSHSPEPTNAPTTSPSHSPEPTHPPTTAPTNPPNVTPSPTPTPGSNPH